MILTAFKGHQSFQKSLRGLNSQVEKKTQQALNRTLQRARTQMTNAVGEKLNLRKKTIRELMSIQRATKITGLIGKLIVKNKPVPLIEYNAKQNRKGVSFKVFKSKSRQLIKHAFITPDSRARDSVFKRESTARLKIKPLYGTRVTDVASDKLKLIKDFTEDTLSQEITRLISLKS
ncbi:MAG: phage tail protein [Gammaproteobacteria bacterium]